APLDRHVLVLAAFAQHGGHLVGVHGPLDERGQHGQRQQVADLAPFRHHVLLAADYSHPSIRTRVSESSARSGVRPSLRGMTGNETLTRERADLLESLRQIRFFLRYTVRDLTDAQATACPTRSALCLGGLIKHVASIEESWVRFAVGGPGEQRARS